VLFSGELLDEIAETLLELGADRDDVEQVLMLLAVDGQVIPIKHQRMGCADEEDDHLFETALMGKADYLVSEDHAVHRLPAHVQAYLERNGIRLCRAREFCEDLKSLAPD
jgi:predicted nucleic acid-binding protein